MNLSLMTEGKINTLRLMDFVSVQNRLNCDHVVIRKPPFTKIKQKYSLPVECRKQIKMKNTSVCSFILLCSTTSDDSMATFSPTCDAGLRQKGRLIENRRCHSIQLQTVSTVVNDLKVAMDYFKPV